MDSIHGIRKRLKLVRSNDEVAVKVVVDVAAAAAAATNSVAAAFYFVGLRGRR
jgi:pyocin large subunit-like protein